MSIVPITGSTNTLTYATPVEKRHEWIELLGPAADLANQLAQTDFVPAEFKNKPAQIAAAVLYGAELGLGPMVSLSKIDIVKGRPAPRAELGRALAFAAGHEIWIEDQTNTKCTVMGKRRNSQHVHSVTWTLDDAKKAGIAGNPNYAKYPRQMLLARASAELVRAMCPEVLGGITVFAEEAVDIDTDVTPTVTASVADSPAGTRRRARPVKATHTPETATETPTATDDGQANDAQRKMAMALFKEIGVTDSADRHAATGALIGRTVTSWNDLTRDEASRVIDGLTKVRDGGIGFEISDQGVWATVVNRDELLDTDDDATEQRDLDNEGDQP